MFVAICDYSQYLRIRIIIIKEWLQKKYKVTVGTVALQMNELYGTSFMLIESTGLKFS